MIYIRVFRYTALAVFVSTCGLLFAQDRLSLQSRGDRALTVELHGHVFIETAEMTIRPLEAAQIQLLSLDGKAIRSCETNGAGYYSCAGVPIGEIVARVSVIGSAPFSHKFRIDHDRGRHVLDLVVDESSSNSTIREDANVEVGVFQEVAGGKSRRTKAHVIFWQNEQRLVVEHADPVSGNFETRLQPGEWNVVVTLANGDSSESEKLTVLAGERRTHQVVLPSNLSKSTTSALIAVRKSDKKEFQSKPLVRFVGGADVIARVEDANQEAAEAAGSAGGQETNWIWYWAYPTEKLAPGEYKLSGTLGELEESSAPKFVGSQGATFKLTFRPKEELGTVAGRVTSGADAPIAGAKATFKKQNGIETREALTGKDGQYTMELAGGDWWITVRANGFDEVPGQQVAAVAAKSATRNFTLTKSKSETKPDPKTPTKVKLRAFVAAPKTIDQESIQVAFETEQGFSIPAILNPVPEDQLAAAGIPESKFWTWHVAATKETVEPGTYRAKATIDQVAEETDWQVAYGDQYSFHVVINPETAAKDQEVVLIVKSDLGQPIPNASVRLFSEESNTQPLTLQASDDGTVKSQLAEGLWWVTATANGFAASKTAVLVSAENKTATITLPTIQQQLDAIIAVERRYANSATELPTVRFTSQGKPIEAIVSPISGAIGGASTAQSAWDWFKAVPSSPLSAGQLNIRTSQDGYITEELTETLQPNDSRTIHLTLRAEDAARMINVSGIVYSQAGNEGKRTLLPGYTIRIFASHDHQEPRDVPAKRGRFETLLPPGGWTAEAINSSGVVTSVTSFVCGSKPNEKISFRIAPNPNANVAKFPLTALLQVKEASNLKADPVVTVHISQDGKRDKFGASLSPLEVAEFDGSRWYRVDPKRMIPAGATVVVRAASDGFHTMDSEHVTMIGPKSISLVMTPRWQPAPEPMPGQLAGCVFGLVPNGKMEIRTREVTINKVGERLKTLPDGRQVMEQVPYTENVSETYEVPGSTPSPIPNAKVFIKNTKTKKKFTATTNDEGCFAFSSLPAGFWSLAVLAPEYDLYKAPSPVEISAARQVKRDVTLPLPELPTPEPAEVVVLVGIPASTPKSVSDYGGVSLLKKPDGSSHQARPFTGSGVRPASQADVQKYIGKDTRNESKWLIARFKEPIEPGLIFAEAAAFRGLEQIGKPPKRLVSPGLSTVFEIRMAAFQPEVTLLVKGGDNQPAADVNIRLIHGDQGFREGLKLTTNQNGVATSSLATGLGTYKVMLSGEGLEAQGQQIEITEKKSQHQFQVYRVGEAKSFPLGGLVVQAKQEPGSSIDWQKANLVVKLVPIDNHAIPTKLLQPIRGNADGGFRWESVPEGDYSLQVRAKGFGTNEFPVTSNADQAGLRLELMPRNAELDNAIRIMLTKGWGSSLQHRDAARKAFELGKSQNPQSTALHFAAALTLVNDRKLTAARGLLESIGHSNDGELEKWRDRSVELLLWLDLKSGKNPTLPIQSLAKKYKSVNRPSARETAFVMGLGRGLVHLKYAKDPLASIDDQIGDFIRPEFIRGRDLVASQFRQKSGVIDDKENDVNENHEQDLKKRLAKLNAEIEVAKKDFLRISETAKDNSNKVKARLAEIDAELRREFTRRNKNNQVIQQIDIEIQRLQTLLNNLQKGPISGGVIIRDRQEMFVHSDSHIRQQPAGGNLSEITLVVMRPQQGGFGDGGGFGGGGNERPPQNNAELERRVRAELINQQNLRGRAVALDKTVFASIQKLQATRQQVEKAGIQTHRNLTVEHTRLTKLITSLQRLVLQVTSSKPRDQRAIDRDRRGLRQATTYWEYPLEERRMELLRFVSDN